MLDIELKWFLVQLAQFLFLLVFLNAVLFKPLLALFEERKDKTTGALESAKALGQEKDDVIAQIDSKLVEARIQAKQAFEELAKEGSGVQKGALESAQSEAMEINKKARDELASATETARAALKANIETFSKQIVEKLVGV